MLVYNKFLMFHNFVKHLSLEKDGNKIEPQESQGYKFLYKTTRIFDQILL